jgi:hypothetical protein
MGKLKKELDELYKMHGSKKKAINEAESWFKRGAAKLRDKTIQSDAQPFRPGMIYVFRYEKPKYMEDLPWWDKNPTVLALDPMGKNDVGINLNLLPSDVRIELLDFVYTRLYSTITAQTRGNKSEDAKAQGPIMAFSYANARTYLEKFGYEYAIRQYIPKLKTKQQVVSFERWGYMAICDFLDEDSKKGMVNFSDRDLRKMFEEYQKNLKNKRPKK